MGWLRMSAPPLLHRWLVRRGLTAPRRKSIEDIVIVGSPDLRPPLEEVVGPGAFRVTFLEDFSGAHMRIIQTMPDRVVLCCHLDDMEGLQLLSMLKADSRTRMIPALTVIGGDAALDGPHES